MKKNKIGIIGCGNMSQAIIKGIVAHSDETIIVSDTNTNCLDKVKSDRVVTTRNNQEVIDNSKYIILAIKPQVAKELLSTLSFNNKIVISIMAGTSISSLKDYTKSNKVVRVMPNLPAIVGKSNNCYCCSGISVDEESFVNNLLGQFGEAIKTDEKMMNVITGISGSGPAFVFSFIKSFVDIGIASGLEEETAKMLAYNTIVGSVELIKYSNQDIDSLIDSVCSKGGTTIEGINYLRANDFERIVKDAISSSIKRSEQLEKNV